MTLGATVSSSFPVMEVTFRIKRMDLEATVSFKSLLPPPYYSFSPFLSFSSFFLPFPFCSSPIPIYSRRYFTSLYFVFMFFFPFYYLAVTLSYTYPFSFFSFSSFHIFLFFYLIFFHVFASSPSPYHFLFL